uniref:Fork-head domain-containing protein n=1 Tax=Steinernema glaseri TaxID=37863 RepID=A0A1I8ALS1_9BILA
MRKPREMSRQNQYGLSYTAMIILAIQNSDCRVGKGFYNKALKVGDLYGFLKAHVRPFKDMNHAQWNQAQRVIRHSLAQTSYLQRISYDEHGNWKAVPSKGNADKGSLWTIHPSSNDTLKKMESKIRKILKDEYVEIFRKFAVNPQAVGEMVEGTWSWKGPDKLPLSPSEARVHQRRLRKSSPSKESTPTHRSTASTPQDQPSQRWDPPTELPSLSSQFSNGDWEYGRQVPPPISPWKQVGCVYSDGSGKRFYVWEDPNVN